MKLGTQIWLAISGQTVHFAVSFAVLPLGSQLYKALTWAGLWVLCGPVAGQEEDYEACGIESRR